MAGIDDPGAQVIVGRRQHERAAARMGADHVRHPAVEAQVGDQVDHQHQQLGDVSRRHAQDHCQCTDQHDSMSDQGGLARHARRVQRQPQRGGDRQGVGAAGRAHVGMAGGVVRSGCHPGFRRVKTEILRCCGAEKKKEDRVTARNFLRFHVFPANVATPASSRQRAAGLIRYRPHENARRRAGIWPGRHASLRASASGFGSPGWIRTTECLSQSQVPYRLATGLGCLV